MRDDDATLDFAETAAPIMEVIALKAKQILTMAGTAVIVGAASTAGAALWTKVLEGKVREAKERITRPKNDKIIDFKKAKRMSR